MNTRKLFSVVAISSALMLGTTGCSLNHNVESLQSYTPSDGSQKNVGDLKLRNFILLSKGEDTKKSVLIGAVVNDGDKPATIYFAYETDAKNIDPAAEPVTTPTTNTSEFEVAANSALSFGAKGLASAIEIKDRGYTPGSHALVYFWVKGESSATPFFVPVLEDKPEQYAQFFTN